MLEVNTVDMMEQLNAFWPIILMVVIFYFMLWRPQKKQQKQRQEMLNSLKAGVKIITAGGIYGTIVSLHDEYLVIYAQRRQSGLGKAGPVGREKIQKGGKES